MQKANIVRAGNAQFAAVNLLAAIIVAAFWLASCGLAAANEMMPGVDSMVVDPGLPPMAESGEGSYFSQDLGTILRLRYNTESYGQHGNGNGNLDIGTMQVVNFEDSIGFFDGQVTLNDVQGIGFNLGLGYRWMSFQPHASAAGRVQGVSIWADGTSTEADNFFPQLGLSYESLGEMWDLRANGYIPLGDDVQVGDFEPTGVIGFQGNSISQLTQAIVDSSFFAGEAEFARRLGVERDAWAFAGPYFLANDTEDTLGYRVGLRGYAYPDLLLQFAVTDDDIFKTNATFSITWFVGRTRTDFQPACGVPDRLREPVMRNDYVVLAQSTAAGGIALTDPDGTALRVVHIDSTAAPGGDGSFENPFDMLTDANGAGSREGDILFAHSQSAFTGQSIILKDNQRFLGEGNDFEHMVTTAEEGTILIPESAPGSRALDRPMILAAPGDAVTLADNNEVANFDIDGQTVTGRAIASPAAGAGNPNLHDLDISNTTGDGIFFTPLVLTDTDDIDGDGNTTEQFVRGNVTISDVVFDNIGGDDIDIDSATTADLTDANITLQETIAITDVTSTNGNGAGVRLQNTHDNRTATITNYTNGLVGVAGSGGGAAGDGVLRFEGTGLMTFGGDVVINNADIRNNLGYAFDFQNIASTSAVTLGTNSSYDGGAGAAGGMRMNNFDGTFSASNTTLTNGTLEGVAILGGSDGTITFANTVTFDSIDGTAFDVNGFTGALTVNSDIDNDTGRSVSIQGVSEAGTSVAFNGDITDTGQGIQVSNNSGGTILFTGDLDLDTDADPAIEMVNNAGADISFAGEVDITTTSADAFRATGGGTLTASNTNNSINTATGRVMEIDGMTISNLGVNFGEVNRTGAGPSSAVRLNNNTGGPILVGTVGDDAGDSGTIAAGTGNAIEITNSANATVSGLIINSSVGTSGVRVEKSNAVASTVNLNDLEINDGAMGVEVIGGGTGNLNMTINDTDLLSSTTTGMSFNNVDAGTIQVNNATIDGNGAASTAGVQIAGSNASFTFDSATLIQEVNGVDFDVNGGTGTINFAGDITNTVGRSVSVQNVTGGAITFSAASSINDTGDGMLINANTGGTFTFLGDNNLNTGANDAVRITNNTGATISLSDLDIDTTTGTGFLATGGGTLTVLGTTNSINTTDGVGLRIEDMTIGAAGVAFESVTATNAAGSAIILEDLTGPGQVSVGNSGGAPGSGGTLTTPANDAVVLRNVANVDLRNIRVANAGGDGLLIEHTAASTSAMDVTLDFLDIDLTTGDGIDINADNDTNDFRLRLLNGDLEENVAMDATGGGTVFLLVEDTDIDVAGATDAFALVFSGGAEDGEITFRDNNDFSAAGGRALFIDSDGAAAKVIDLLVEDSDFSSATNPFAAVDIRSRANTTLNATIEGNDLSAPLAANDFDMRTDAATGRIRLKLGDAVAADQNRANGAGTFVVREVTGDFDIFEVNETIVLDNRNVGPVNSDPNDAAFDDLPTEPPLPTLP